MPKFYGATTAPLHGTIYNNDNNNNNNNNNRKGYFSVNPILRFGSLSRIFINKVLLINNELSFLPWVLKSYK